MIHAPVVFRTAFSVEIRDAAATRCSGPPSRFTLTLPGFTRWPVARQSCFVSYWHCMPGFRSLPPYFLLEFHLVVPTPLTPAPPFPFESSSPPDQFMSPLKPTILGGHPLVFPLFFALIVCFRRLLVSGPFCPFFSHFVLRYLPIFSYLSRKPAPILSSPLRSFIFSVFHLTPTPSHLLIPHKVQGPANCRFKPFPTP